MAKKKVEEKKAAGPVESKPAAQVGQVVKVKPRGEALITGLLQGERLVMGRKELLVKLPGGVLRYFSAQDVVA
jgi:hypothetical protein